MSGYQVPKAPLEVEEVIKNSRFITRILPTSTVEEAKAFIKQLNQQEPDANHHCWAYIVGNPASTTLLGCSDDGEPSGTAGKPMLHVLQHSDIGDITAVCTRYFGGTKLGTGGLARAYGGGVKLALEELETTAKIETSQLVIETHYECEKDIHHQLKQYQGSVIDTQYGANLTVSIRLPTEHEKAFKEGLAVRFGEKVKW